MNEVVTTIAMLAVVALLAGGLWLILKAHDRTRGMLMIVAALVLLGNVMIWQLPIR